MRPKRERVDQRAEERALIERRAAHVKQLLSGEAPSLGSGVDELIRLSDEERAEVVLRLLAGPDPEPEKAKVLRFELKQRQGQLQSSVLGGIYFWLFGGAADSGDYKTANELFRKPEVREFVFDKYEVDEDYRYDDLELHRAGTTSFILRSPKKGEVLKILRWKVMSNPEVTLQTQMYADDYAKSQFAPGVLRSRRYFILMDFVEGLTLREFARERIGKGGDSARLDLLIEISRLLCHALAYYARPPIQKPHLDLSPDNVIVTNAGGQLGVKLIDFGYNSALKEGVTSAKRVVYAQRFIDPALLVNIRADNSQTDIYSLGVMLLDLLIDEESTSAALDRLWRDYPYFAPLIEDMIDKSGENRLLLLGNRRTDPDKYLLLQQWLELEAATEKAVRANAAENAMWRRAVKLLHPAGNLDIVRDALKRLKSSRDVARKLGTRQGLVEPAEKRAASAANEAKRLVYFAAVALSLDWITIGIFTILAWRDLGIELSWATMMTPMTTFGDLREGWPIIRANLPGRFVAFSFSAIAASYYLNLYATLSVRHLSRSADFAIRSISWLIWLPIVATVLMPRQWPYFSGFGALLVALANFACFRLAAQAENEEISFLLPPTGTTVGFRKDFGNWGTAMLLYGVLLLAIGVLLTTGLAVDAPVYASLCVVSNIWIYVGICLNRAPAIRATCLRCFSRLTRWQAKLHLATGNPHSLR